MISYIQLCEITSEENVYSFPCESGIAEILFTTGTTGSSKGIIISNKANVALAENIITGTQMQHNNVELIPLPISHSHGLRSCYANLLNGSTIVLADGVLFICADHGNAEKMIDYETGAPHTAHTTNPVPFILVNYDENYTLREGGRLCDIAPTLIEIMGLEKPVEMTGESLLVKKN